MADNTGDREIAERRNATTLINMLPLDPEAAIRVLEYAKELVEGYMRPRGGARLFSIKNDPNKD